MQTVTVTPDIKRKFYVINLKRFIHKMNNNKLLLNTFVYVCLYLNKVKYLIRKKHAFSIKHIIVNQF